MRIARYGNRISSTPNGPNGTQIAYYLKESSSDTVTLTLTDSTGKTARTINGTNRAGLNRVALFGGGGGRGGGGGGGRRGGGGGAPELAPGEYTVTLKKGDKTWTKKVTLAKDDVSAPDFRTRPRRGK